MMITLGSPVFAQDPSTPPEEANAASTEATAQVEESETAAPEMNSGSTEVLTEALLDKQLHEVSTHLDTLKEDTFATKSRLLLLREEVLQRSVGGSRVQLRHKNDMGGQYTMVQLYYAIDRETVYTKLDSTGALDDLDDELVYDRILAPGTHQLTALYVYRGRAWGIFQYMKDYTFRVESGYDFVVEEGKSAELTITASEVGGAFTPYEERPGIQFDYQQYDLIPAESETDTKKTEE